MSEPIPFSSESRPTYSSRSMGPWTGNMGRPIGESGVCEAGDDTDAVSRDTIGDVDLLHGWADRDQLVNPPCRTGAMWVRAEYSRSCASRRGRLASLCTSFRAVEH